MEISVKNEMLDRRQLRGKNNRWRFLCYVWWHKWSFTHLFDEQADYNLPYGMHQGSSHYAGICSRCGARDLFRGPLQ